MAVDDAHLKFATLLAAQTDAYLGNEGALFAAYGDNAATPLTVLSQALSSRVVLTYLIGDRITGKPAILLAPFSFRQLPGVASPYDNTSYGFIGDVSPTRPNPNVMRFDNANLFNLTANVWVPMVVEMSVQWTATAAGEIYLPVYAVYPFDGTRKVPLM